MDEERSWLEKRRIPFRVFVNYDGGGFNYYIWEFQAFAHAHKFNSYLNISSKHMRMFAEDEEGYLHSLQNDAYRGYTIVTSSSGGNNPPYTASYGVVPVQSDGTCSQINHQACGTQYQTEEDAHAGANIAARKFIDSKVSKK